MKKLFLIFIGIILALNIHAQNLSGPSNPTIDSIPTFGSGKKLQDSSIKIINNVLTGNGSGLSGLISATNPLVAFQAGSGIHINPVSTNINLAGITNYVYSLSVDTSAVISSTNPLVAFQAGTGIHINPVSTNTDSSGVTNYVYSLSIDTSSVISSTNPLVSFTAGNGILISPISTNIVNGLTNYIYSLSLDTSKVVVDKQLQLEFGTNRSYMKFVGVSGNTEIQAGYTGYPFTINASTAGFDIVTSQGGISGDFSIYAPVGTINDPVYNDLIFSVSDAYFLANLPTGDADFNLGVNRMFAIEDTGPNPTNWIHFVNGNQTNTGSLKINKNAIISDTLTINKFKVSTNIITTVLDATVINGIFITNADFSISGFTNAIAGYLYQPGLTVSNSSASNITVTFPGCRMALSSTNQIPGGQEMLIGFDLWPNIRTNVFTTIIP